MKKTGFKVKQRKPMKRTPFKKPLPAGQDAKKLLRLGKMPKRKPSGQAKVFKEIWEGRPHECEVCRVPITEPRSWNFSHLLPKGVFPELKLDPRNILLKCKSCHDLWHQHGAAGLRYSFPWIWVVGQRDELYNERLTAKLIKADYR